MSQPAPIAVALDAPDLETAARWAGLVTPHVSTVKVGLAHEAGRLTGQRRPGSAS